MWEINFKLLLHLFYNGKISYKRKINNFRKQGHFQRNICLVTRLAWQRTKEQGIQNMCVTERSEPACLKVGLKWACILYFSHEKVAH